MYGTHGRACSLQRVMLLLSWGPIPRTFSCSYVWKSLVTSDQKEIFDNCTQTIVFDIYVDNHGLAAFLNVPQERTLFHERIWPASVLRRWLSYQLF